MKKKIISLTLATLMVVATLVGCGSKEKPVTPNTNTEVTTETPTPDTTTPEVDVPETEVGTTTPEDVFSTSYALDFPSGMTGFTDKFVFASDETWSLNDTHYVDAEGNEMNFEWEGPTTLGENAVVSSGHPTLVLGETSGKYVLCAWTYGYVDEAKFKADLEFTKETWTSFASVDIPYVENGYYNIETTDTTIEVTFEVANDTKKGYDYYIVDLNEETCYQFTYLEDKTIYDDTRAMKVVESIKYWDYEAN